ncbi:MAG: carboxyl transferase domain-containing protein [Polyangia bacterium]|jgi:glutaconyl-CoA decarboxylase|nr:carboxyl transferase domain-containing protein [Polyangia bacterium]
MRPYFQKMNPIGKPLTESARARAQENAMAIRDEEALVAAAVEKKLNAGLPAESLHKRGQLTAMERLEKVLDPGSWRPLATLYDPQFNEEGTTALVCGLGQIEGRQCMLVASDNKVLAGAWIKGQPENVARVQDIAESLRIPLVWLVNCSGVKLTEQEEVYAGRRSGGRAFFRHSQLNLEGVPVIAGVYGTNPAGGGYHCISPTIMFAHKDANMAVGGGGIVSGMSPKGYFDLEGAEALIEATRHFKAVPPGGVKIHHDETGFFRTVHDTEEGVLAQVRKCVSGMPAHEPSLFRVAEPADPAFPMDDLYYLVAHRQKQTYDVEQVIARLVDGSEHMEFRPGYGPEVYTGLVKMDGFLCGLITNRQGFLGKGYPEYAEGQYLGIGGKLYRQGLIKMNEFVTLCGRDQVPIIWIQDTTGIDVGDIAEKAELLGLGQSLIYSIERSEVPMMCLVLRKGTAAAHYIMGGPQASRNNTFTIGCGTTEIYVMHGETASAAAFARRLVKEKDSGKDLGPTIEKMNALAQEYRDKSRPTYSAQKGFVDEIVPMTNLRSYMVAFARSAYQNPRSLCPHHQMMLPRIIKG